MLGRKEYGKGRSGFVTPLGFGSTSVLPAETLVTKPLAPSFKKVRRWSWALKNNYYKN